MGIGLQGVAPDWTATEYATAGAVVSESLARRLWPGENPIGKGLRGNGDGPIYYRVVGVADDVRHDGFDKPPTDWVYFPLRSLLGAPLQGGTPRYLRLVAKARDGRTDDAIARVRHALTSVDADIAVGDVHALDDLVERSYASRSLTTWMLGAAALMALLASGIGLYGVISYSISTRRTEFGVRLALGASPAQVRSMVIREALLLVAIGTAIGAVAMVGFTRMLTTFLFNVSGTDPLALAAITCLLLTVGIVAGGVPAWRASRLDPIVALRCD
jgi:hypothetical protein